TQLCHTTIYDRTYIARIDTVVQEVTSRGMLAVLELTFNPRFACVPQSAKVQKMASFPGSALFWQSVASRYKDNPLVAFELYNEPHDISDDVWLRGGMMNDLGFIWRAAGMQQLYDAVRGT